MVYKGNKRKIIKWLNKYINFSQEYIKADTFYDIFAGGYNVVMNIDKSRFKGGVYANDINKYIKDYIDFILESEENIDKMPDTISREEWEDIKNNKDNYPGWLVYLAGTRGSFRYNWFHAYGGQHAMANGVIFNEIKPAKNEAKRDRKKMMGINKMSVDYRKINIKDNSVIYCDPPYKGTSGYKYAKNFDCDSFYDWAVETGKKNVVLISEYDINDDRFKCIANYYKQGSFGYNNIVKECLFVPITTLEYMNSIK